MKSIAVVYHSKYGSTKRYAQWLAHELSADLFESKQCRPEDLDWHDVIVYAGNIYASSLAGSSILKKNLDRLAGKLVVFLAVGAAGEDPQAIVSLMEHNFKGTWLKEAPVFYVRGAFDVSAMNFLDRKLCGMLRKSVAKKDPAMLEPWEKGLLESFDCATDWTSSGNLVPIIEYIRSIQ